MSDLVLLGLPPVAMLVVLAGPPLVMRLRGHRPASTVLLWLTSVVLLAVWMGISSVRADESYESAPVFGASGWLAAAVLTALMA